MNLQVFIEQYWPMLALVAWFGYKWWNSRRVLAMLPDLKKEGALLVDVRSAAEFAGATGFDFIKVQRGMFSYTGLTAEQVERLRAEFGIYAVSTGRICVAALNTRNIDYVAKAIAAVLKT